MSAIGSVSVDSGVSTLFQRLAQSQTRSTSKTEGPSEAQKAEFEKKFEAAAEAAGVDISQLSGLRDQIQSAISSVLEAAQSSGDTSDLKESVKSAVEGVLRDNGIDPEELETRLQTAMKNTMGEMGGPPPGGGMGGPPPMGGPGPSDEATDSQSSTVSGTTSTDDTDTADDGLLAFLENLNGSGTDKTDFLKSFTDILFGLDVRA